MELQMVVSIIDLRYERDVHVTPLSMETNKAWQGRILWAMWDFKTAPVSQCWLLKQQHLIGKDPSKQFIHLIQFYTSIYISVWANTSP